MPRVGGVSPQTDRRVLRGVAGPSSFQPGAFLPYWWNPARWTFLRVRWFFRAIEAPDGTWSCRRGRTVLDEHHTLVEAIAHLRELAQVHRSASLFAHWRDGRIEHMGDIDPQPS